MSVRSDAVVLARALLGSGEAGATGYIGAGPRDTGPVLTRAAGLLNFTKPVAITVLFIPWPPGTR